MKSEEETCLTLFTIWLVALLRCPPVSYHLSIVVFLLYLHWCSYFHDVTFLFIACIFLTNPPSCFYKYLLLSFTCLMAIFLFKSNFRIVFLGWPLMRIPGTVREAFLYASVTPDIFCLWRAARTLLKRGLTDLCVHASWLCGKLCKLLWISWYMLDSGFIQLWVREFKSKEFYIQLVASNLPDKVNMSSLGDTGH